jgi:hypothetical protein
MALAQESVSFKHYRPFQTYGGIKLLYLSLLYRAKPQRLRHRREFGIWLNARGFDGVGAEIGVKEGKYSERILFYWKGKKLYSIDPWREFSHDVYKDQANVDSFQQEKFYQETCARLAQYGERNEILRLTSEEAAREIEDGSLDFAYIDAQHHYAPVKQDIKMWWPKIRRGGVLCGHDYFNDPATEFEVKRAVDEFVAENPGLVFFQTEKDKLPSWYVLKPLG